MIRRTALEQICIDLQKDKYCPLIRPQPVQGVIDVIILQSGLKQKAALVQRVLEDIPCRVFVDDNASRRARVEKQYRIPVYAASDQKDELARAVKSELKTYKEDYQDLEAYEKNVCARLRVIYREVRPSEDGVVIAVLPSQLFVHRLYDALCPQLLSQEMVRGIGLAVLNPPKVTERPRLYQKARRAEDMPELQRFADELRDQERGN